NRRLSVQTLVQNYKLDWHIDRITIVGELAYDLEELGNVLVQHGFAKESYSGFNLIDEYQENIAYFEMVKFHETICLIDFNLSTLWKYMVINIKNFIHVLFIGPHFSRADVACDIYNLPNSLIQQYQLADPVSYRPIYGRSVELETLYWG